MNTRNPFNLTLGAWNVRTTNDTTDSIRPERATAIITRELAKANIDICALSEVRREGQGNLVERDYTIYWSGGTKKEAGVGFAISNKLSSFEMTTVPISDRLMVLRIRLHSGKYLKLVSVYAPTMQRTQEEKELFYQSLTDVLRSDRDDLYLILGDFNARVGSDWQLWPNVLGKHGIGKMNSNGLMLLDFCTQNSFTVMGSVFQLSNKFKTSWQHLRSKHWHQIDHVLADPQTRPHISITQTYLDADCYSDHKLVIYKNRARREIQQEVRKIKNDWFIQKASEAERYRLENNLKDFYATLREVYGPSSRNSHPIKSKDGKLLTTKGEIKERWGRTLFRTSQQRHRNRRNSS
ncbi:craniofacial development protein 2-like [Clytia hemisphaerica]|uniref:craniofacial development protein 2-like n=1 Tax=Clytia hemisphaerica TaxID=252671 RepID=UPI0034D3E6E0